MLKDNLITINALVADRTYRIKIEPQNEEQVRRTIKLINDKISEFKKKFEAKDTQDYVSMVLIWLATEMTKSDPAKERELENEIDELIKIAEMK